ncbi:MAG: SHOCT domain-containing protein [Mycolicibacterium neoaurum]|uniref:SHOCT domain-containing protein n=1 Tax=Mycolicibacterium neoaurum TaxID=1795 RepID=UPI002FF89D3C
MAREAGNSIGLGFGNGSVIDYGDSVEYRQTGKLIPAFRVTVADITGFSVRKVTRDDKKRLDASALQQVFVVQGSGTTLAEVAVNHGTAAKIEQVLRAHPRFGSAVRQSPPLASSAAPPTKSWVDELAKLAALRDTGALTPEEFETAKRKLLS